MKIAEAYREAAKNTAPSCDPCELRLKYEDAVREEQSEMVKYLCLTCGQYDWKCQCVGTKRKIIGEHTKLHLDELRGRANLLRSSRTIPRMPGQSLPEGPKVLSMADPDAHLGGVYD